MHTSCQTKDFVRQPSADGCKASKLMLTSKVMLVQATAQYFIFSEKPIPSADLPYLLANLALFRPSSNAGAVWEYLRSNWDAVIDSQAASG